MIAELQHPVATYAHALDELKVPALQDTTWTFTVPGQGVLGPVAGRTAVLDFVRDGHAAQTGKVRHHLSKVVAETADANSAQVRAYLTVNTAAPPGELDALISAAPDTPQFRIVTRVTAPPPGVSMAERAVTSGWPSRELSGI